MKKIYEDEMNYEPIDLCRCFDPIFSPPKELLKEWNEKSDESIPTEDDLAVYVQEPDGLYLYYSKNYCIKVTEHFSEKGKEMTELVEDVVKYSARQKNDVKLVG